MLKCCQGTVCSARSTRAVVLAALATRDQVSVGGTGWYYQLGIVMHSNIVAKSVLVIANTEVHPIARSQSMTFALRPSVLERERGHRELIAKTASKKMAL